MGVESANYDELLTAEGLARHAALSESLSALSGEVLAELPSRLRLLADEPLPRAA